MGTTNLDILELSGSLKTGAGLANAVNIDGAATGVAVSLSAVGSDANIGVRVVPKGTGRVAVTANGLDITGTATVSSTLDVSGAATLGSGSANEVVIAGAASLSAPTITATGSDADVGIQVVPKGLGRVAVTANGLDVTGTATVSSTLDVAGSATLGSGSANEVVIAGAAAAANPTVTATGSDADVGINLVPKGIGRVAVTANGLDVTGTATVSTSLAVGAGTAVTKIAAYAPSLTPASVAADTSAEQTFTVTGLTTTDKVIVNGPTPAAGTGIVNAWVSAADTLALTFMNATAAAVTPTAGTYTVVAIRS